MSENNAKIKIIEARFSGINKYLFLHKCFQFSHVSFLLYILLDILFESFNNSFHIVLES